MSVVRRQTGHPSAGGDRMCVGGGGPGERETCLLYPLDVPEVQNGLRKERHKRELETVAGLRSNNF